jgi:hypothetical protein
MKMGTSAELGPLITGKCGEFPRFIKFFCCIKNNIPGLCGGFISSKKAGVGWVFDPSIVEGGMK